MNSRSHVSSVYGQPLGVRLEHRHLQLRVAVEQAGEQHLREPHLHLVHEREGLRVDAGAVEQLAGRREVVGAERVRVVGRRERVHPEHHAGLLERLEHRRRTRRCAIIDGAAAFGYFACASIGRMSPTGSPSPAARSISFAVYAGVLRGQERGAEEPAALLAAPVDDEVVVGLAERGDALGVLRERHVHDHHRGDHEHLVDAHEVHLDETRAAGSMAPSWCRYAFCSAVSGIELSFRMIFLFICGPAMQIGL